MAFLFASLKLGIIIIPEGGGYSASYGHSLEITKDREQMVGRVAGIMIYKAFFGVGGGHTDIIEQNIFKKGVKYFGISRKNKKHWNSA